MTAAALVPGAAVFASTQSADCAFEPEALETQIEGTAVVVVGTIDPAGGEVMLLRPEAFLKGSGPTSILLQLPIGEPACAMARISEGQRYLMLLRRQGDQLEWPATNEAFVLEDGHARSLSNQPYELPEDDLVREIREVTGQYLVPAQSDDEGEGIEWTTTVLPIAVALGIVFVIGLFLMRIWHRIDPS